MRRTARQTGNLRLRPAFTLVELLVVMGVLAMMASMVLVGLASAAEQARAARTRSQVQKIHELLMTRWEEYRYRRVEPATTGDVRARQRDRVDKIRQLMRMEMPCHIEDVQYGIANAEVAIGDETGREPALWLRYRRAVTRRAGDFDGWSKLNDDAECLYMILESIQDGDTNGLDFFKASEIGDTDGDGMPEILDGWGQPINFLRWAPGFVGVRSNLHRKDAPDPFDPLNVRGGRSMTDGQYDHFPLYPLVASKGPDGQLDIVIKFEEDSENAAQIGGSVPNNPYYAHSSTNVLLGAEYDTNDNGVDEYFDNITNHALVIGGND